jgi:hypothetical protein
MLLWPALALIAGALYFAQRRISYPTDKTPEGAYYRIVTAINLGRTSDVFPYLETRAQHASFSICDYSMKSYELVSQDFPEPQRARELKRLAPAAQADGGVGVFVQYADRLGWSSRLRRDLSGIAAIDLQNERATVETVRGTRYPFRVRENGIWGLTLFTAPLVADAEKAARDYSVIQSAAADYRAAKHSLGARPLPPPAANSAEPSPR